MRMVPRRLALALGGVAAAAGLATAQPAPLNSSPVGPPAFPRAAVAAPMETCAPAGMVSAPGYPATSGGGCATCGGSAGATSVYAAAPGHHGLFGGKFASSPVGIGEGCAATAGCSSYAQERTFFWGGCKQFFGAGNKCDSLIDRVGYGGGRGIRFGKHDITPPGPGGLGNPNPCVYGSYANR